MAKYIVREIEPSEDNYQMKVTYDILNDKDEVIATEEVYPTFRDKREDVILSIEERVREIGNSDDIKGWLEDIRGKPQEVSEERQA